MTKNAERRKKFRRLAPACQRGNNDRDYLSGFELAFDVRNGDKGQRDGFRVQIPFGPQFRTPQWERSE